MHDNTGTHIHLSTPDHDLEKPAHVRVVEHDRFVRLVLNGKQHCCIGRSWATHEELGIHLVRLVDLLAERFENIAVWRPSHAR